MQMNHCLLCPTSSTGSQVGVQIWKLVRSLGHSSSTSCAYCSYCNMERGSWTWFWNQIDRKATVMRNSQQRGNTIKNSYSVMNTGAWPLLIKHYIPLSDKGLGGENLLCLTYRNVNTIQLQLLTAVNQQCMTSHFLLSWHWKWWCQRHKLWNVTYSNNSGHSHTACFVLVSQFFTSHF